MRRALDRPRGLRSRAHNVLAWAVALSAVFAVVALGGCGSGTDAGPSTTATPSSVALWKGPAPNATPMGAADAAAVDDAAGSALKQADGETPGLWLGVWDPDKGMHAGGYGFAELPATAATGADHGRVGSLTKTFTATEVLRLVDQGDLSLDDTVADVLPDLATTYPDIAGITVQQLLGMTSGIPDYANLPLVIPQVVADPSKVWSAEEIVGLVLDQEELAAPGTPGYSTTNYLILGMMIEEVTGRPVEEVVTELAGESGLTETALTPGEDNAMPEPFSHGYVTGLGAFSLSMIDAVVEPGTDVTGWSASWGGAGGGMYSTVEDLGKWAATGFGNSLLTPATVTQRFVTTPLPEGVDYGLGIIDFGDGWIGHTGQIVGWEAIALYNTETGAVYAALVNETGSLGTAIDAITRIDPELREVLQ